MNKTLVNEVKKDFKSKFGTEPLLIFSPGRINIIGEHFKFLMLYQDQIKVPGVFNQRIRELEYITFENLDYLKIKYPINKTQQKIFHIKLANRYYMLNCRY